MIPYVTSRRCEMGFQEELGLYRPFFYGNYGDLEQDTLNAKIMKSGPPRPRNFIFGTDINPCIVPLPLADHLRLAPLYLRPIRVKTFFISSLVRQQLSAVWRQRVFLSGSSRLFFLSLPPLLLKLQDLKRRHRASHIGGRSSFLPSFPLSPSTSPIPSPLIQRCKLPLTGPGGARPSSAFGCILR